jgi:glycosyltransferase involved in cell wall biosynthesis
MSCSNVTVIGPLPPIRGGIARHTRAVADALAQVPGLHVDLLSFARLYPGWLYPGEAVIPATGAPFQLDTINPLSWRRAVRSIIARQPDLVVIPAWTFFVAPMFAFIAARLRRANIRVGMIVHNLSDHEGSGWKDRATRQQLQQADFFITHSAHLAAGLAKAFPHVPVHLQAHPAYDDFPAAPAPLPRRAATELLFFGYVREYKGVDVLLQAMARLADQDVKLTIAGEVWTGGQALRDQIAQLGLTDKVELLDRYIDDSEVAALFGRCDALVLPYRAATGSGVIATAHHFGTRVIASDIAGLREAVSSASGDMLVPVDNPEALAAAIGQLANSAPLPARQHTSDGWNAYCAAILAAA